MNSARNIFFVNEGAGFAACVDVVVAVDGVEGIVNAGLAVSAGIVAVGVVRVGFNESWGKDVGAVTGTGIGGFVCATKKTEEKHRRKKTKNVFSGMHFCKYVLLLLIIMIVVTPLQDKSVY
jgi:hypothetical protein